MVSGKDFPGGPLVKILVNCRGKGSITGQAEVQISSPARIAALALSPSLHVGRVPTRDMHPISMGLS